MTGSRETWKKIAHAFAVSLDHSRCADHDADQADLDNCPFCRDTAAVRLYRRKTAGKAPDLTWQTVAEILAVRFRHFTPCADHAAAEADPDNCPFCGDQATWERYVSFCQRTNVPSILLDTEVYADAPTITLEELLEATRTQPEDRAP